MMTLELTEAEVALLIAVLAAHEGITAPLAPEAAILRRQIVKQRIGERAK